MKSSIILICSVILFLFNAESKAQIVVRIANSDGYIEKYLFKEEKMVGTYNNKGKLHKLSKDDIVRQKIFLRQTNSLITYGIRIKYPEVLFEDACIIADILSSYDPDEVSSFSHPIKNGQRISIDNINKYFTYLDARVDYIFSLDITVKNNLITQYTYKCKHNLSDEIVSYTCVFEYDNDGRLIKSVRSYGNCEQSRRITYNLKK